jgi:chemotaxis protein CheX
MPKILVVDDSHDVRHLLSEKLLASGHVVVACETASEALKELEANVFDLSIMDIQLPDMSGLEVISKLLSIPLNSKLPVIVISGLTSRENIVKALNLGVHSFLAKPFSFNVLSEKIENILNPYKSRQGAFDPVIIKIFLEATMHVFHSFASLPLTPGKPYLKSDKVAMNEISAVIGLASPAVKGSMAVNMDRDILVKVLQKLFGTNSGLVIDHDAIKDVCGEMANQILGRAKQQFLRETAMSFEITVPTVVVGKDHILNYKSTSSILVIPFKFDKQNIFVEFCLELNDRAREPFTRENLIVAVEEGELLLF